MICVFPDSPELHPASSHGPLPEILKPYDPSNAFGKRILANLDYLTTSTGWVIRDLNSSRGVPYPTFNLFRHSAYVCIGCNCYFSVDGFNRHLIGGLDGMTVCGNHPESTQGKSFVESLVFHLYLRLFTLS